MDSKELRLVQENHATVKLDSSIASHGMLPCYLLLLTILHLTTWNSSFTATGIPSITDKGLPSAYRLVDAAAIYKENQHGRPVGREKVILPIDY